MLYCLIYSKHAKTFVLREKKHFFLKDNRCEFIIELYSIAFRYLVNSQPKYRYHLGRMKRNDLLYTKF